MLLSTLVTSTVGLAYVTLATAKVQRLHVAAGFTAALLVGLEAFAFYKFLLLPLAQRGADAMRFQEPRV